MILNLFASRTRHPLADPRELQRVVAELPLDNAFKAADEVLGWLEALAANVDLRADQLFDIVRALDEAAQPHIRRLARDYLNSPRLSRSEERRLWTINFTFWQQLAACYTQVLTLLAADGRETKKAAEALKPNLALLHTRLTAALGTQLKWIEYRYGPIPSDLWARLGNAYLAAEDAGLAARPLQLYPQQPGVTSTSLEYLRVLVLHASSLDRLLPLEIELADRLIQHFLPGFRFSPQAEPTSVYWVDAGGEAPPKRLALLPKTLVPTLRFFSPGDAAAALEALQHTVERGEVPGEINLGGAYPARVVLPVLRHLALYWAAQPPLREHRRHAVKSRLAVLHGFDDSFTLFAGEVARAGMAQRAESWVVENVSLGGFGAVLSSVGCDWLRVGTLISMQPEGGDNWVLGVVRRFARETEQRAAVGVQTLARVARSVELIPRASSYTVGGGIPGIRLDVGNAEGEMRLALPPASFDLRENLEYVLDGQRYLLTPVELLETGADFEIGRYREERL